MSYRTKLLAAFLSFGLIQSAPAFANPSCETAYKVSEGGVAYLQFGKEKPAPLPEPGPGQRCEKIWANSNSNYVIAQIKSGLLGTQVIVQHTYLLVYKLERGALKELKQIELQNTERSSKGTQTLKDCEAKVPELGNQSRFEIQLKCQGSASVEIFKIP